jgi:hypothetical protein
MNIRYVMIEMSKERPRKRTKIKGHYMQVRQRSTRKGKKGTILGKWESEKKGKRLTYRCKLTMSKRLQEFCGHKKAGFHCLKGGDNCPQLIISYQ